MKTRFRKIVAATLIACVALVPQSRADDIDLYTGGEAATGAQTNVLLVLDNSTNWAAASQHWATGKQGESELEALSEVVGTLGDTINLGLLLAAGSNGGYVRFSVREMNTTNKTAFQNMFNTMVANFGNDGDNDDKVNTASIVYDNMMNAAYRYFNGFARFGTTDLPSGSAPDLRDYTGSTVNTTKMPAGSLAGNSLSSASATTYNKPAAAADGCAKNFIIFIGNGYPNQSGATADLTAAANLAGITDATTLAAITASISGGSPRLADEWARFMYNYGVMSTVDDPKSTTTPKAKLVNKITTYTIDVCKDACEADQATLLKSMAKVGGGKYFKSTSKAEIKNALALIFAEIQAVNSVFASATLPISVNTQGTYENQVYIGVFRPDAGSRPRWLGNLKEYKFGRYCDADRNERVLIDGTRTLVNGMIPATLTGTATGTVTGTFTGSVANKSGTTTSVSGTVTGTISGTTSGTLAATITNPLTSAGTSVSPGTDLGSGTVSGTISGTGTGSGTSTFTGTLYATPSLSGSQTATDERIGDDVPAPNCGTDATGKIPLKLFMGDANGFRAIDEEGNTGFMDLSTKSFWTAATSFWGFSPTASGSTSDLPDGPNVERGGAAQRLRDTWGGSGTPDGRKIYTCLGSCLGAAAGDTLRDLTNAANAFKTTNGDVTSALAAPSGSVNITLTRSGTTVTATTASGTTHPYVDGNSVVIAGVTGSGAADYNGTKTVTTGGSNTTFTYAVTETPATPATGTASFSSGSTTRSITSIALSGTGCTSGACKPGSTVTATLVAGGTLGATADVAGTAGGLTVSGSASTGFLNKTGAAMTNTSGTTYTYSLVLPAAPGAATGATATASGGSPSKTGMSIAYDATNNRFTLSCVPACTSAAANRNPLNSVTVGSSVTVTNASDDLYNGTWVVQATGNISTTLHYRYYGGCGVTVPNPTVTGTPNFAPATCGGSATSAAGAAATENITITRAAGSSSATTTASVTTAGATFNTAPNILSNGDSVSVTATGYTNAYTVSGVTHSGAVGTGTTTFTISGITTGPAAATGTITATLSGAGSGPTTNNLIDWTRGKDLWEDENLNSSLTDVRASIHGDVLHSRPVVVNYGSSIGIVSFYGSNDGFLRAVHGGISSADGEEKWAFIPTEFVNYTKLARLYSNSELVRFPNTACSVSPAPTARTYMWDGVMTAWQSSDGTASTAPTKTWLFATMRRGGRAIYGFDVSDPDTPKVMWRITNASTGFAELGQTWSEPKVTRLKGSYTRPSGGGTVPNPVVLIFGAGYDAAQEDKPEGAVVTPTMGRGVFVVEAETGQLIKFLSPSNAGFTGARSFPADVSILDLNSDGYVDRIYAGDTNANIFRFDTVQTVTDVTSDSYWLRYHVARLGDISNNGSTDARKFMYGPELLPFSQSGTVKVMVLVGSGNREKPLGNFNTDGSLKTLTCSSLYSDTYYATGSGGKIRNRFYGVLDAIQSGAAENSNTIILESAMHQINDSSGNLTSYNISASGNGWYIQLRNDPDGNDTRNEEKTVNAARVVAGTVFFATNTPVAPNPSGGVCSNLGEALGYAVDPFTGMPAFNRDDSTSGGVATYTLSDYAARVSGGGLPPTVTAGVVSIGGTPYRFCIGICGDDTTAASPVAGARSTINLTGTRTRLFWSYGAD